MHVGCTSNTQTKLRLDLIPAQGCAQGVDGNRKNWRRLSCERLIHSRMFDDSYYCIKLCIIMKDMVAKILSQD